MSKDLVFICITPVRNEAWILPFFLKMNSLWADIFIIIDQTSTDGTTEILSNHPKVSIIKNENQDFNELYRSKVLWENVRKIDAKKKIVFALDADEYIPLSSIQNNEWANLARLAPGTRIFTSWIQILPGLDKYFAIKKKKAFGYVDDGKDVSGGKIHNDRVPLNEEVKPFYSESIFNIHLGYVCVNRNYKKHTWYLMWEYLNVKSLPFDLNYNYRKFIGWNIKSVKSVKSNWLPPDITEQNLDINKETITWWDQQIIDWLKQYGEKKFKKLDIWKFDWNIIAQKIKPNLKIKNPQSFVDKKIVQYISYAKYHKNLGVRILNYIIKNSWK